MAQYEFIVIGSAFSLPLKGGGRRPKAAGWGSRLAFGFDPHPDPPPLRGRERTTRAGG